MDETDAASTRTVHEQYTNSTRTVHENRDTRKCVQIA